MRRFILVAALVAAFALHGSVHTVTLPTVVKVSSVREAHPSTCNGHPENAQGYVTDGSPQCDDPHCGTPVGSKGPEPGQDQCLAARHGGYVTDGDPQLDWDHCVGPNAQACKDAHDVAYGPPNAGNWTNVATCESGQNWSDNTGNGFEGGLQFMNSTWLNSGGGQYASHAYNATPNEQMVMANRISGYGSNRGPWPVCGRSY